MASRYCAACMACEDCNVHEGRLIASIQEGYVIDVPTLADLDPLDYLKPSQRSAMEAKAARAAQPPKRTPAEYRAQRKAQATANASAKAEAKAAAKAATARRA